MMGNPLSHALSQTLNKLSQSATLKEFCGNWEAVGAFLRIPRHATHDGSTFVHVAPVLRDFPAPYTAGVINPLSRSLACGLRLIEENSRSSSSSSSSSGAAIKSDKQGWACVGVLANVYTNIIHIEVQRGGFDEQDDLREQDPFKTAVAAAASVTGMQIRMAFSNVVWCLHARTVGQLQSWVLKQHNVTPCQTAQPY
jgi:hypothetical protein